MKLKLQFIIAIFIALVVYIPAAQAQANLTFSGGNGAPLSITLLNPVTYTINNTACTTILLPATTGPLFVFDEAGNPFSNTFQSVTTTSTIRFSINGGASQPITTTNSGRPGNDRTTNDIYAFGNTQSLSINSTIVLSPGTITTTANIAAAPPANGSFPTFITNNFGTRCSTISAAPPTAATVSVGGRVMTASGRGIVNVRVSLTDSNGQVRTATSTAFGYYRFDEVQAGETHILSAAAKRYTFSQPVQVINVNEATDGINFIADSNWGVRDF